MTLSFSVTLKHISDRADSWNIIARRDNTQLMEKPQWLSDAMGSNDNDDDTTTTKIIIPPKLSIGLSGFCLDPDRGFVAILTSMTDDNNKKKYTAVTVVPDAKPAGDGSSRITSPQALTLVQLAGGLDLGTPILPPDALWQTIVREGVDNDNDDDEDEDDEEDLEEGSPPPLVTLLGMEVVPNEDYDAASAAEKSSPVPTKAEGWTEEWMQNDARIKSIQERATQVVGAVKGLPGLQAVTLEQVTDAMMYCANQEGALDRQGFSHLLDYMRRLVGVSSSSSEADGKVKFVLNINLVQKDSIKTISVTTIDAFRAIGLSMRHKIQLQVAPECLEEDPDTILEKFPAFRSIQELWEDAKILDGFIPSMFEKAKKQQGNNDGPPSPKSE